MNINAEELTDLLDAAEEKGRRQRHTSQSVIEVPAWHECEVPADLRREVVHAIVVLRGAAQNPAIKRRAREMCAGLENCARRLEAEIAKVPK